MKITLVDRNKKNKDRMSVYIDGNYAFTVSEEDYLRLNLYEEKEVTQEEITYIKSDINVRSAQSIAIKYLSLKLRSAGEVQFKLTSEGFDVETAETVIEELKSMGYINDKIYVQKYLFDRSKLKPKSKKLLKTELLTKGIQEEIINEILKDWEIDDFSVAESLARKKFGKYDLSDGKIVRKLQSFLYHRGFSFEVINTVVDNMVKH